MDESKVVRISEELGPPESEFERAAVEQLLSAIRKFRGDTGYEPQILVYTLMAEGDPLRYRSGHMRLAGPSARMCYAFASAVMLEAAVAD